jgi:hypothetical protein
MKTPKQAISKMKETGDKLRNWRVVIMRARAQNLGTIKAADRQTAEVEAVQKFGLSGEQPRRLLILAKQ